MTIKKNHGRTCNERWPEGRSIKSGVKRMTPKREAERRSSATGGAPSPLALPHRGHEHCRSGKAESRGTLRNHGPGHYLYPTFLPFTLPT